MRKPTITSKALWVSEDLCWLYKEYELLWYIIYIVVDKKIRFGSLGYPIYSYGYRGVVYVNKEYCEDDYKSSNEKDNG